MKRESDTRQRLLDTAIQLIWEQSYGAVSVDDICERAGARKGSFYHFFPSKSDLTAAALEAHWEKLRPELDRIFSPQSPPLERLADYCDFVHARQQQKMREFGRVCGCPFASLGSELSTQDETIRRKSQQILERRFTYFTAALRDAVREGLIPEQDCEAKARDLYGCIIGVLLEAKIENDLEMVRNLKPTIFRLIGATERQPAELPGVRG
ncbi:MAG TPA: TetR/AcrR family transcriptional regulator [Verrucomicrobiae bacterium]|nr:TetR/AcrR family transcriptional regulator [Verrucomicrobiae bacterium]